ncbi:MAG: hypothetical protein LBU53_13285 [Zoogloeaceae bacterium]|jgi:hypothetical protein|nr:hypothetical protein [Zoogloeaceae bacterium]
MPEKSRTNFALLCPARQRFLQIARRVDEAREPFWNLPRWTQNAVWGRARIPQDEKKPS